MKVAPVDAASGSARRQARRRTRRFRPAVSPAAESTPSTSPTHRAAICLPSRRPSTTPVSPADQRLARRRLTMAPAPAHDGTSRCRVQRVGARQGCYWAGVMRLACRRTNQSASKGLVLALDFHRKQEEVTNDRARASTRTAVTRPCRATGDVHVVVDGDLLTHRDRPAGDHVARACFVAEVRIGVTRVVEVPTRKPDQNDLAVRIVTMVGPFTEFCAERRVSGDLAYDIDPVDDLALLKGASREQPEPFNRGSPDRDSVHVARCQVH